MAAFLFVAADELHGELRFTAGVYRQRKIHQGRYPFKENVVRKLNVRNLRVSMLAVVLENSFDRRQTTAKPCGGNYRDCIGERAGR